MMKKVSFKLKTWGWSLKKQNYLVLKLGLPILLVGLVFRIYFPRSSEISPVSDISFQQTVSSSAPTPVAMSLLVDADSIPPNGTQNSNTTPDSSSLREDAKEGEGIEAAIFEDDNGVSTSEVELHLDKLDATWTEQYKNLDYIMFSSGEWFVKSSIYYENNAIVGCHNCPKRNFTQVGFVFAYGKVLRNAFDYITESNHKGMILFRTITPDHFENGEWFSGGSCNRTEPVKEGEFHRNELNKLLRNVELEEFQNASAKASEKGVNLKLFDVNPLSLLRPDGHPGPYRFFQPFAKDKNAKIINDCLHWCLPGPIDSWNDLLMEMVVDGL